MVMNCLDLSSLLVTYQLMSEGKRSMNTLLHALKSPNIQGVLSGDSITHIRAPLKRLHSEMLLTMGGSSLDAIRKVDILKSQEDLSKDFAAIIH